MGLYGIPTSRFVLISIIYPTTNKNICHIKNGICKITFHFSQISGSYQQHEFFYRSDAKLAESFSGVKGETQSIRVYKDGKSYKFESSET